MPKAILQESIMKYDIRMSIFRMKYGGHIIKLFKAGKPANDYNTWYIECEMYEDLKRGTEILATLISDPYFKEKAAWLVSKSKLVDSGTAFYDKHIFSGNILSDFREFKTIKQNETWELKNFISSETGDAVITIVRK